MLRTEQHLCSSRDRSDHRHALGVLSEFNKDQIRTKLILTKFTSCQRLVYYSFRITSDISDKN